MIRLWVSCASQQIGLIWYYNKDSNQASLYHKHSGEKHNSGCIVTKCAIHPYFPHCSPDVLHIFNLLTGSGSVDTIKKHRCDNLSEMYSLQSSVLNHLILGVW